MVLHIYSLRTPSFPVALFFLSVFIAWRISSSENSLSRSGSLRVLLLIDISGLSLFLFRVLKWSYKLVMSGNVLFLFCLLEFSIFQYCFGFVDFRCIVAHAIGAMSTPQQTRNIALVLFQCWASVADDGPTLIQHMVNVPSLLGALPRMSDRLRQRRPCKHMTLNQCWADVGLTSATLAQHQPSIVLKTSRDCWGPPWWRNYFQSF